MDRQVTQPKPGYLLSGVPHLHVNRPLVSNCHSDMRVSGGRLETKSIVPGCPRLPLLLSFPLPPYPSLCTATPCSKVEAGCTQATARLTVPSWLAWWAMSHPNSPRMSGNKAGEWEQRSFKPKESKSESMILIKMAENCGSDVYGALLFSRRSTAIGMRACVEITAHFEGKDFIK